jgi:hypothetical protein
MSQSLYELRSRQVPEVSRAEQLRGAILLAGAALVTALVALAVALVR